MKRTFSHGSVEHMIDAFENKIDALERRESEKVESATYGYEPVEGDHQKFLNDLMSDVVKRIEQEMTDTVDGAVWDQDDDNLYLTVMSDGNVTDFTIPFNDIIDGDVEDSSNYIFNTVWDHFNGLAVESSTKVNCASRRCDSEKIREEFDTQLISDPSFGPRPGVCLSALRYYGDDIQQCSDDDIMQVAKDLGLSIYKVQFGYFGNEDYLFMKPGMTPKDYADFYEMDENTEGFGPEGFGKETLIYRGRSDIESSTRVNGASITAATHWTEAYEEFEEISERFAGDEAEIRLRVNELYSDHAGEEPWEEAYRRWNDAEYEDETDLDDEEKHELEQKISKFLFDDLNDHFEHGLVDRLEKAIPEYRDAVNVRATRERWDELEDNIKEKKQDYVRAILQSLMEDKI